MWRTRHIVVGDENRIAVGRTLDRRVDAYRPACTDSVLDKYLLAELARHVLSDHASDKVQSAACREWHDETYRPVRPLLRMRRGQPYRCRAESIEKFPPPHVRPSLRWGIVSAQTSALLEA